MTYTTRLSKIGIIISLIMVAHSLVYLNEFSLTITIAGYILAVVSTIVYALHISPSNTSSEDLTKSLENSQEIKTEAIEKGSLKLLEYGEIAYIPRQRSGLSFDKSDYTLEGEGYKEWREPDNLDNRNSRKPNVPECQ